MKDMHALAARTVPQWIWGMYRDLATDGLRDALADVAVGLKGACSLSFLLLILICNPISLPILVIAATPERLAALQADAGGLASILIWTALVGAALSVLLCAIANAWHCRHVWQVQIATIQQQKKGRR